MFTCPHCDKAFRHQSSLCRHVRGNVKEQINPCSQNPNPPERPPKKKALELVEYDFDDFQIPDFIDIGDMFDTEFYNLPARWLKAVHMNPNYPHLSNIVLSNLVRGLIRIYMDGRWSYMPFKEWSRKFIYQMSVIYAKVKGIDDDVDKGKMYEQMIKNNIHIKDSLRAELMTPLREVLKKKYGFR